MVEFLQNYGLWIVLFGGMFVMHRLGIGCCGGHSHGQSHGQVDPAKVEPRPTEVKPPASQPRP